MGEALGMSPGNTAPSYDAISDPFVQYWHQKAPAEFVGWLKLAVSYGNRDWHQGQVVLIRKANKPHVTCVHVPVTVHRSGQCRISYV